MPGNREGMTHYELYPPCSSSKKENLGQDEKTLETSLDWISYKDLTISESAYDTLCEKMIQDQVMENPHF